MIYDFEHLYETISPEKMAKYQEEARVRYKDLEDEHSRLVSFMKKSKEDNETWTKEKEYFTIKIDEKYTKMEKEALEKQLKEWKNEDANFNKQQMLQEQNWLSFKLKRDTNINKIKEFENYLIEKLRDETFKGFSGLMPQMLNDGNTFYKFFYVDKKEKTYHSNLIDIDLIVNCKDFNKIEIKFKSVKKVKPKRKEKNIYSEMKKNHYIRTFTTKRR